MFCIIPVGLICVYYCFVFLQSQSRCLTVLGCRRAAKRDGFYFCMVSVVSFECDQKF